VILKSVFFKNLLVGVSSQRIIIYLFQSKILFKKGADDGTNSRIQWFKSKAHERPRERHKLATKGSESSGQQIIKQHSEQSSLSAKTNVKNSLFVKNETRNKRNKSVGDKFRKYIKCQCWRIRQPVERSENC